MRSKLCCDKLAAYVYQGNAAINVRSTTFLCYMNYRQMIECANSKCKKDIPTADKKYALLHHNLI